MTQWQYTPYILPLLASALVTTLLALYSWRHRTVPGAAPFALTMLMVTSWSLANSLELAATQLNTKLFWANVQYLSYVAIPVSWLAMALQLAGRDRWLTEERLAWLCLVPAITLILVWSSDVHGLMRYDVHLNVDGPFSVIEKSYGPWFWVHAVYSYLLLTACIALLVERLLRTPALYRGQLVVLLVGMVVPMAGSASYWLGFSPIERFDASPVLLGISGIMVAWALFRYGLFDIVPVAHDTVIEGMGDGVIVLDSRHQITGLNPAAERIFGRPFSRAMGRQFAELFGGWPQLVELSRSTTAAQIELTLEEGERQHHYEVHVSPLADRRWGTIGSVIALRDITDRKQAQEQVLRQQRALAVLEERERLARELHDSLGQVLGYVNTQAQAVRELLARGNTTSADSFLARLVEVAQDAHADVREYILGLKAATSPHQGFFPALRQYLHRFGQNHRIALELSIPAELEQKELDPAVQVQLLRIIQEALTNVRKHAEADRVAITFAPREDHIKITVQDNGHGFDVERASARDGQHFGLRIMQERAQEVNGNLQLHSLPGQGTRVTVQVPVPRDSEGKVDEAATGR